MISSFLERINEYVKYNILIKDRFWFKKLKWFGIPLNEVSWSYDHKVPILILPRIVLTSRKFLFLLEGYSYLKSLIHHTDLNVKIEEENLIFQIQQLNFMIDSKQEILILKEIFVDSVYNFSFQKNSIVLDIGFNVGMASLFFAKFEKVKKIYAYEPIKQTLDKGIVNLNLNPDFKDKITLNNYGLGYQNSLFNVGYNYKKKGNIVITQDRGLTRGNNTVEAIIKNASHELDSVLNKVKDEKIVVKMDCEGGEYDIIQKWSEDNLLNKIDVLLLEFHFKGSNQLRRLLYSENFECITLNEGTEIGFLYAWNQKG